MDLAASATKTDNVLLSVSPLAHRVPGDQIQDPDQRSSLLFGCLLLRTDANRSPASSPLYDPDSHQVSGPSGSIVRQFLVRQNDTLRRVAAQSTHVQKQPCQSYLVSAAQALLALDRVWLRGRLLVRLAGAAAREFS